jgi:ribosomal protein L7/L12
MKPVDIWLWIVILVAAALIALVIVNARAARSRVDPTQVSIDPALVGQLRDLEAKGKKLDAVRLLRKSTGLGLADAVRIVDKLAASGRATKPERGTPDIGGAASGNGATTANIGPDNEAELRTLVAAGQQIQAIKMVRELTGMGLKEAKDFVDRL